MPHLKSTSPVQCEAPVHGVLARFGDQWNRGFDIFWPSPCTLFSLTAYFECVCNALGNPCLHSPMRPSFLGETGISFVQMLDQRPGIPPCTGSCVLKPPPVLPPANTSPHATCHIASALGRPWQTVSTTPVARPRLSLIQSKHLPEKGGSECPKFLPRLIYIQRSHRG